MRLAPRKRPLHLLRMITQLRTRAPPTSTCASTSSARARSGDRSSAIDRPALRSVVDLPRAARPRGIRELYARADIFVAPANLESFGIAALEARCAGVPVVAKARTGIREFVEHGREGLLAAGDHEMVDQLQRLVGDPELRAQISAFNTATPARCEWPEVVQLTMDAYGQATALVGRDWSKSVQAVGIVAKPGSPFTKPG